MSSDSTSSSAAANFRRSAPWERSHHRFPWLFCSSSAALPSFGEVCSVCHVSVRFVFIRVRPVLFLQKRVCRSISICSVVFILFAFDQFLLCLCSICSKINGFVFNLFDVSCFYLLCYFRLYFFSTFLFLLALFPARFFLFMFVPFLTRLFVLCAWWLVLLRGVSYQTVFGSGGGFDTMEVVRGCSYGVVVVVTVGGSLVAFGAVLG
jgi:hypothetical protein